jgi:hypothetical protein
MYSRAHANGVVQGFGHDERHAQGQLIFPVSRQGENEALHACGGRLGKRHCADVPPPPRENALNVCSRADDARVKSDSSGARRETYEVFHGVVNLARIRVFPQYRRKMHPK